MESGTPRSVRKIIKHPEYVYGKNDIAILILEQDYELSKYINPVDLPPPGHGVPEALRVTGWFFLSSNMIGKWNYISNACDYLDLNTVPFYRHRHQICTYKDDKSQFQVYPGAPAVYSTGVNKPIILVGIYIWGRFCPFGSKSYPALYTRVSEYVEWIDATIENGLKDGWMQMNYYYHDYHY